MDPDREVDYGFYDGYEHAPKKQKSRLSDYDLETMLAIAMADIKDDDRDDYDDGTSGLYEEECILEYHGHEYGDYDWRDAQKEEDEKYEKMWPAVEIICDSLVRRPREWKMGSHSIKHKPTGQVYWTGTGTCAPITETYMGRGATKVFSVKQGEKIREALNARDIHNPTDEQLKIMKGFGVAPQPFKPEPGFFGRLWAAIKFFPILVRFCVSK